MTENFKKDNFEIFKEKIFKSSSPTPFSFKKIITGIPPSMPSIPIIPTIYFTNLSSLTTSSTTPPYQDNIGSKIINSYYTINSYFQQLYIIKNFILSILRSSKFYLEKMKVSKERYKLSSKNLIIKFKDTLSDDFDIKDFVNKFNGNNYNLLNNKNINVPDFFIIFQNEYKGKSKSFYINLFKKYIEIRKKINEYIKEYYGLLSFNLFFDISAGEQFEKMKYLESLKNISKKNNMPDYNKYILFGEKTKNNFENDELKIGDIFTNNPSSSTEYKLIKIDFINNREKPYVLKNISSSTSKHLSYFDLNTLYTRIQSTPLSVTPNIKKITNRSMKDKIHHFDLLYKNILNQEYYKMNHINNVSNYYIQLKTSIDKYVGVDAQFDLFNVASSSLEADFNIIKFIFYYIDPIKFNRAVDINYKIKDYIYKKINNFEEYYDEYVDWYNIFIGAVADFDPNLPTEESDFKSYFDKIFNKNIE